MKETVKVKYKAIFKYPEHSEVMDYQGIGELITNQGKQLIFTSEKQKFNIKIVDDVVFLQNNNTNLKLQKDTEILNTYNSPYGTLQLTTKLMQLQYEGAIKINYTLLEGEEPLCQVYILINLTTLEN